MLCAKAPHTDLPSRVEISSKGQAKGQLVEHSLKNHSIIFFCAGCFNVKLLIFSSCTIIQTSFRLVPIDTSEHKKVFIHGESICSVPTLWLKVTACPRLDQQPPERHSGPPKPDRTNYHSYVTTTTTSIKKNAFLRDRERECVKRGYECEGERWWGNL